MKGGGTDEQTIIDILTHRTYEQRNVIAKVFNMEYEYYFRAWLSDEVSGVFGTIMDALMLRPTALLADHLKWAMKGGGTDEQTLLDILLPMTTTEKPDVISIFQDIANYPLRDWVAFDTSNSGNQKSDSILFNQCITQQ